jgi:hypothetical protein
MSQKINLTTKSPYALAAEVVKMEGLLKVLQESTNLQEFQVALSYFFEYTMEQLEMCLNACTLTWYKPNDDGSMEATAALP